MTFQFRGIDDRKEKTRLLTKLVRFFQDKKRHVKKEMETFAEG